LFNVYGICEALTQTAYIHPEGVYEGIYCGRYNLEERSGVIAYGRDLVSIDSLLLHLTDPVRRWVADLNRTSIDLSEDEFGVVDREPWKSAEEMVGNWVNG
jgi:hypothetical protein